MTDALDSDSGKVWKGKVWQGITSYREIEKGRKIILSSCEPVNGK